MRHRAERMGGGEREMTQDQMTDHTDEVFAAYGGRAHILADVLGTHVSAHDPDRVVIEEWARSVPGPILDVGSGTGRWTGYLAERGFDIVGLEPVTEFIDIARHAHPTAQFRRGALADIDRSGEHWAGILAWYSLIHLGSEDLQRAFTTLHGALGDGGTLLMSYFASARPGAFSHPVATAYRWAPEQITDLLGRAGFTVEAQSWDQRAPYAVLRAKH